jgi:hypothetical protein
LLEYNWIQHINKKPCDVTSWFGASLYSSLWGLWVVLGDSPIHFQMTSVGIIAHNNLPISLTSWSLISTTSTFTRHVCSYFFNETVFSLTIHELQAQMLIVSNAEICLTFSFDWSS